MIKNISFEEAEILAKNTSYVFECAETETNPINWGDATGFFQEGYNYAIAEVNKRLHEKDLLIKFFLWFRENGEKYLDKSIDKLISIYLESDSNKRPEHVFEYNKSWFKSNYPNWDFLSVKEQNEIYIKEMKEINEHTNR